MVELKAMYKIFPLLFIKPNYHISIATCPCFSTFILIFIISLPWGFISLFTTSKLSWSHHAIFFSFISPFFSNTESRISSTLIIKVICLLFRTKFNAKFWNTISIQFLTIIIVFLFHVTVKYKSKCTRNVNYRWKMKINEWWQNFCNLIHYLPKFINNDRKPINLIIFSLNLIF